MPGLQVVSAPIQPTLNPIVQTVPTQPALAPRVLSVPQNAPVLAPKVVTRPQQPQLNPQVQTQSQGQQSTLSISYGNVIDSIIKAKGMGADAETILTAIVNQNPNSPATQNIQKALEAGADPNAILDKTIQDNYTPSTEPSEHQPGLLEKVGKGIIGLDKTILNPALRFGVTAYDAIKTLPQAVAAAGDALTGNTDAQAARVKQATAQMGPRQLGPLGQVKPFGYQETQTPNGPVGKISAGKTLLDAAGAGAEIAANFIGGEGAVGAGADIVKGSLLKAVKTGAVEGLKAGAVAGAGSSLQADNPSVGGVLKSTAEGAAGGAITGGALATIPALAVESYRFAKGVKNFVSPDVEAAFMKALKPGTNNTNFKSDVTLVAPILADTEKALGKPVKNLTDLLDVVKTARQRIWATVQQQIGSNEALSIDGNKVADAMISSIDKRFRIQNPAAADRIEATANTYRRQIPVTEAEAFLESANNDLNNFYAKSGFKQKADARNPEIGHVVREAEALRTQLNQKLSTATGKDFGLLKNQYGALSNLEQVTTKRVNVAERQQPNSLAEQIGLAQGLANVAGSVVRGNVGDAIKGGTQIAAAHFIKNRNTSDALIENAFNQLRKGSPKLNP